MWNIHFSLHNLFLQFATFFTLFLMLYFLPQLFFCAKNQYLTKEPSTLEPRLRHRKQPVFCSKLCENFFKKGIDFIEKWRYNVKLYEIAA